MELRAVTYEELRTSYFTKMMGLHESFIEEYKDSKLGTQTKEDFLSSEGMKVQFYRDALAALNWIKIKYDEEGMLVSFPEEGECALFCSKRGDIFLDEVCVGIESGEYTVYLDSGFDIDDLAAYMHLPKPYKARIDEEGNKVNEGSGNAI